MSIPRKPTVNTVILQTLKSIESKIDRIDGRIGNIEITSAKQEVNLLEHSRRCDLLEKRDVQLEARIEPLEQEKAFKKRNWKMIGTILGVCAALGGAIEGLVVLIEWFHNH